MRDGTILRADVHRPGGGAERPLPTVLLRTPYDKSRDYAELDPRAYLDRGFAVVVQDVRGRYRSEGSHYHGRDEVEDGYDTLEWIAAQPWSDGKVGMTGLSYPAAVQCAAACSGTERLVSMFHVKSPANYYLSGARRGASSLGYVLPIELLFACTSPEALADPTLARALRESFARAPDWMGRLPLRAGRNPLASVPDVERFYLDVQEHSEYTDFWKANRLWSPEEHVDEFTDTAALFVGGWYDLFREDRMYSLLRRRGDRPVRLLMGPWCHRDFAATVGDVDFGPSAALSPDRYTELQLEWFEETLQGVPPSGPRPPVTVFVMGGGTGRRTADGRLDHGGRWRTADDWPLSATRFTPYYLHGGGRLLPDVPPGEPQRPSRYVHDPDAPVPTIGGTGFFLRDTVLDARAEGRAQTDDDLWVPYGPQDQRERLGVFGCSSDLPLSSRTDVLTFETEPLPADVEVTGPIEVTLWISSSATDTDFVVKLVDVYPPNEDYPHGYAMNLGDGVLRAGYREGFERRVPLEPGEAYELRIGPELMYPTANLFCRGHRIRLHIASSDYPAYDVNGGHGERAGDGVPVRALNTIYHEPGRLSRVVLPVIPA